ncbi:MAG TPA: hypothetical protein VGF27_10195 [Pseudoduganella sp.]
MIIGIATIFTVFFGPLLLWLRGRHASRGTPAGKTPMAPWTLTIMSALLYVLAFNLTFFIQELFLVLPKAFTPGLRPTLFHNNHSWEGTSPLASLFQGPGALATTASGVACALLLRRGAGKSAAARLFLFWMAYSGVFMALPQVVVGAVSEQSDLGMAMGYFGLGAAGRTIAGLLALALIPLAALWLGGLLLRRVTGPAFRTATLPALLALPAIALFRIPREWIEVVMVPLVVTVPGLAWIQAGAWRADRKSAGRGALVTSIGWPLAAVLGLLAVFQLLLRPGIRCY